MNDDLISRQAAIDAVNEWFRLYEINRTMSNVTSIQDILRQLPPAQPERKTGRWEYVDYGGFGNWHCTACREICICNGDFEYCPNCGAKMEVEHE